jgi:hypothetical protein
LNLLKAFEFAESFSKPASSNSVLPLENRFPGVAPTAPENRPVPISPVLKHAKYVPDEQFSFEKLAAQCPLLLKAGQRQILLVSKSFL